jgi:hypothetical protein
MNAKLKLLALASLACALFTGCAGTQQNKPMTAAIVRATVSTGALFGISEDPTVVPYLQAATPVICDAAGKGTLDPAAVVAALQAADVDQVKTPQGVAIINSGLAIYEAIYASYGTNVQASVVQPYLEGVCLGLRDALPKPPAPGGVLKINRLPPHVSMKR